MIVCWLTLQILAASPVVNTVFMRALPSEREISAGKRPPPISQRNPFTPCVVSQTASVVGSESALLPSRFGSCLRQLTPSAVCTTRKLHTLRQRSNRHRQRLSPRLPILPSTGIISILPNESTRIYSAQPL